MGCSHVLETLEALGPLYQKSWALNSLTRGTHTLLVGPFTCTPRSKFSQRGGGGGGLRCEGSGSGTIRRVNIPRKSGLTRRSFRHAVMPKGSDRLHTNNMSW